MKEFCGLKYFTVCLQRDLTLSVFQHFTLHDGLMFVIQAMVGRNHKLCDPYTIQPCGNEKQPWKRNQATNQRFWFLLSFPGAGHGEPRAL